MMLALLGVTVIEEMFDAGVGTIRGADPATFPLCAVMEVWPAPMALAKPALETVATAGLEELHCTELEISEVLPSE